MSTINTLQ